MDNDFEHVCDSTCRTVGHTTVHGRSKRRRSVAASLPPHLDAVVRSRAASLGISVGEVVRRALGLEESLARAFSPAEEPPKVGDVLEALIRADRSHSPADALEAESLLRTLTRDAQETTSTASGLLPSLPSDSLIAFYDRAQAVVHTAFGGAGAREAVMPPGKNLLVPDVSALVTAGLQSSEFSALSSTAATIGDLSLPKQVLGGALDLSEQVIDWASPGYVQEILEALAGVAGVQAETSACLALERACNSVNGNVGTLDVNANAAKVLTAVGAACNHVFTTAKVKPDTIYAAPDRWAFLVGLTATDGVPVLPLLLEGAGLDLVTSNGFEHGFIAVAASEHFRVYEQRKGFVSYAAPGAGLEAKALTGQALPVPGELAWTVAFRAYFAAVMPPAAIFSLETQFPGSQYWSS